MIPGRGNPWWTQREAERAALEHEASKILARDRRRQRKAKAAVAQNSSVKMPILETPTG